MIMPTTQIMSARPTEPERPTIDEGVAKIPVPTMRLNESATADQKPS